MKFICNMSIVQTYLAKWREKRISTTPLPKFWEKVGERIEKWCDGCGREIKEFLQWYCQKLKKKLKKLICSNWIAKSGGLKKWKKEN